MIWTLFVVAALLFVLAYWLYGGWQEKLYNLDNNNKTPAYELYDGIDYVPTHPMILLGHHFSSIAGAGPIVGPIAAASMFGWLPAYLWIVIGSIFFGGVQDMGAIVGSIRHKGLSVGELINRYIGKRGKALFNAFAWSALVLLIASFLQLAAVSFAGDPAVAFTAVLYIVVAVIFGLLVYRFNLSLGWATLIMLPFVVGGIFWGNYSEWVQSVFKLDVNTWQWILIVYICAASVLPVWLLLQPRDYLSSWFLYFAVFVATIGILFGGSRYPVKLDAFKGWYAGDGNYLWPILFITIACGAISGFHSLVGSGTTAKQLKNEKDAKFIGYGGMLLEGLVAIIAVITVIMAGKILSPAKGLPANPQYTFGVGFAKFWSLLGLPEKVGISFGMFTVNTFILTTLDTATRLGRYQFQELTSGKVEKYTATLITVLAAVVLVFIKSGETPIWKLIWPVFGSANQLTAGLALLGITAYIIKALKKPAWFTSLPMVFMIVTTLAALVLLVKTNLSGPTLPLGIVSIILIVLAVWLMVEGYLALIKKRTKEEEDIGT
ncbi:carbon starvation protein A [Caldicellulosiruptor changbaiensis]|uniref:Carbon starvation protein A n=1 Tax=Caldicellulosiruptor changbaiensis TaxID=1222016 RepID=A0A3T0D862_9FIRM|nr:carbon starvation protein A [Caldicellulosiruptor changbaiensis]AZT91330.1 carbon starvation protein A [Caldicellulosiruptor changbaiensis]